MHQGLHVDNYIEGGETALGSLWSEVINVMKKTQNADKISWLQ